MNFAYLLLANERRVQIHRLFAYDLVAHAVHIDRLFFLLKVYSDLVDILLLAARFYILHQVDDSHGRRLELQSQILRNRGQRSAIVRWYRVTCHGA